MINESCIHMLTDDTRCYNLEVYIIQKGKAIKKYSVKML